MAQYSQFISKAHVRGLMIVFAFTQAANVSAFEPETHSALSILAARNHYQSQVGEFVAGQLRESRGLLSLGFVDANADLPRPEGRITITYLDALGLGAEDEDSPYERSPCDFVRRHRVVNHFYDPTRGGVGLNDATSLIAWIRANVPNFGCGPIQLGKNPQTDSLLWAWDNRDAVRTERGNEDYSWQHARRQYFFWLTEPNPVLRAWRAGETFYALGHITHLVQDLAQPQHTRNDAHLPAPIGDDAPFEKYCLKHYGTPAQIAMLPFERLPKFKTPLPAKRPDGIPPEFRAFWNTDQLFFHPSDSPTYSGALGLAEFSNFFFVTDDTMFTGEPQIQPIVGHQIVSFLDFEKQHAYQWPRLSDIIGWETLLPQTPYQIALYRSGEINQSAVWEKQDVRRISPDMPDFCSAHLAHAGAWLLLGLTDRNREAHARVLLPKAIAYSTGLLNYFFRGRLKMEFIYPETSGSPQLKITNLTINESVGCGEALGPGSFMLLREDPITTNRTEITGTSINSSYLGTLEFGHSFEASLGSNFPRDGNLILVFKGTIGNEENYAIAAVVSPGLCNNFELLANDGTNATVQVGDVISFTRYRLNADGTRTNMPVTSDDWNSAFSTWPGTPINGFSETGDHESYAFMRVPNGRLAAHRRGTWTLRPNRGGCVTVVVEGDLIQLFGCAVEASIDGTSLGMLTPSGNELGKTLFPGQPGSHAFRYPLSPGEHQVTFKNHNVPRSCGFDFGGTTGAFEFFGGIWPLGQSFLLIPNGESTVTITAPRVPGD